VPDGSIRWEPHDRDVDFLIERRKIERVVASDANARHLVREARRHLSSAAVLAGTDDVSAAFVTAYDAARKALSAILAVQGLRTKGGNGGHAVLLDVVRPQFPDDRAVLARFEWLRNVRNSTQYPDFEKPTATPDDVSVAIPAATRIVELAEAYVAQYGTA
jgi:HEPN domain-containing protein